MLKNRDLNLRSIVSISIVWWVALFLIGILSMKLIPFTNTFSFFSLEEASTLPRWFTRWGNFDGGAYILLSERGYRDVGLLQAFFPAYPLLIRLIVNTVSFLFPLSEAADLNFRFIIPLAINFICFIGFLHLFNEYLKLRFDQSERKNILLAFLFFPTTFFLHGIYTEAFFLSLLTLSLYSYQQKKWLILFCSLSLLCATRIVGVLLIPAIIFDMFIHFNKYSGFSTRKVIQFLTKMPLEILAVSSGVIGLGGYMLYLFIVFGDPLYFFSVQSSFGAGRQSNLVSFLQVVWRYFKILWTVKPIDWKYFAYVQEFIATIGTLAVLMIGFIHSRVTKLTIPEVAFSFAAIFLPALTGNFSSMSRYILVCLPIYIIFGQYISKHPIAKVAYILICSVLSFINIMLFIQGRWVA